MYNESIYTSKKLTKKINSCIDFENKQLQAIQLKKHISKYLLPNLEKKLDAKQLCFSRCQLISLGGENQFYNSNCFYHCNEKQSYTCFYFFQDTTIHIIPHKSNSSFKASRAYKKKHTVECRKNSFLLLPSSDSYCYDNIEGHILQVYDIINKDHYDSYIQKLKLVEVNKNTLIEHFCKRIGLCYKNKLHYLYHWIHFIQYCSVRNDFQFKLCLTDIKPEQKKCNIISYENRPHIIVNNKKLLYDFDKFIHYDENLDVCIPDNYYLFQFVKLMVLLMMIVILIIFWKDTEIRNFLGEKRSKKHSFKGKKYGSLSTMDETLPLLG